jgi:hypothetical protein
MTAITWDGTGERLFETGVDHGVLYLPDESGLYSDGVPWNGLTGVTEAPTGAEANPQYADNIKYLNLYSAEEFGATIEAFTFPEEFYQFDGMAVPVPGVVIGQQARGSFGFSYRTRLGNDVAGDEFGYKLHLIYGAKASPSEKAYATVNDTPEAMTLSWEITTTPVAVAGHKNTAQLVINSTEVDAGDLADLEDFLYGTVGTDPSLPPPGDVIALFETGLTVATPTEPSMVANVITIPSITGVQYYLNGVAVSAGALPAITANAIVRALPTTGYRFPAVIDNDWLFTYVP